jgi:hypothetical protein
LWTLSQLTYITYGYLTNQVGFLLLGLFNIVASLFALFFRIGNFSSEEEEEYEDQ